MQPYTRRMERFGQVAARAEEAVSAWRIALAGALALAAAVGIGRFAFTPILPMMQEDAGLSVALGGWIASANYVGYLVGALWAMAQRVRPSHAIRSALVAIALTTLAMGWAEDLLSWVVLRAAAGVASAWGLIHTSAWCVERLARLGRPLFEGAVFAGVGVGIVVAGVSCAALMHYGAGSREAWLVLGGICLVFTAMTWPVLGIRELECPPPQTARHRLHWTPDAIRLVLCYGASGMGYIIPATFLPAMARDIVQDPVVFGWAWPVLGLAAASSTLFAAPIMRALGNRRVWMLGALVMALGVAFPLMVPGIPGVVAAAMAASW
ncbi:MAG: YbfB/YjiJ family MFS transporter [Gammaproteobacteria bacterium]